jgi:hypothetical protein
LGMTPSRDTEKHNFFPGDNNSSIKESQAWAAFLNLLLNQGCSCASSS